MSPFDAASMAAGGGGGGGPGTVLPPETLSSHLSALELITAMWQGTDELQVSDGDAEAVQLMGEYLSLPLAELGTPSAQELKDRLPGSIRLSLLVHPENGAEVQTTGWRDRKVRLDLEFFIRRPVDSAAAAATAATSGNSGSGTAGYDLPRLTVRSPDWLRREAFDRICETVKDVEAEKRADEDDGEQAADAVGFVMDVVERISQVVLDDLAELPPSSTTRGEGSLAAASHANGDERAQSSAAGAAATTRAEQRVLRTWSYLPSLSSREKRNDIVTYALSHTPPLTGFVLAGKPGLIVLEHPLPPRRTISSESGTATPSSSTASSSASAAASAAVGDEAELHHHLRTATSSLDAFWSRIKSQSWADIPSGHKKVSEKYREENVPRAFDSFEEMTEREEVGGKEVVAFGGKRNKSDLRSLQQWLDGKGLEGRMEKVLGAEWRGA